MLLLIEGWAGLLAIVLLLATYRSFLTRDEDDTVHLADDGGAMVRKQTTLAKRVNVIEIAGKTLTVLLVLYGIFIAGQIVYQGWLDSMKMQ